MPATITNDSIQFSGGLVAPVVTPPITVTGGAIDLSLGNYFVATVAGNTTFSLSNIPTAISLFTLEIVYTNGIVTFFSGVQWVDGEIPFVLSAGNYTYTFTSSDGGTTWKAIASQVYEAPPPASITLNTVGTRFNTQTTTIAYPAGTQAGDLAIYYDHPWSASGVTFSSVTPTSPGGSWTSIGGTNVNSADSTGSHMWYRVLTASDISNGSVTGRSAGSTTNLAKSLAVFRKSTGSIVTVTLGGTALVDTGTDNAAVITTSAAAQSSIVLALMLVTGSGGSTVTYVPSAALYSQFQIFSATNDIAGNVSSSANAHGPWLVIPSNTTKFDLTWTHSYGGGSYASTVRNYLVVT